jgi:GAF domain-containing protein
VNTLGMLEISRRLSAALTPADLDATLANITAAAVEVLPEVKFASITVLHADGRLETFAPTAEVILEVDAAQYELREGPCYEAAVDTSHLEAPYLAQDTRFPRYAPVAVSFGIQAQAGIRLFDAPSSQGALNLYAETPGAFEDFNATSELFSHQAAVALAYARHVENLEQAIESRQLIGQAVGVVMERFHLDDARAFAFLTRVSSHQNIKVRVIAERILAEPATARNSR